MATLPKRAAPSFQRETLSSTLAPTSLDWLIVAGVVLSPVTAIAVGPLNIGELLVLFWCLITLFHGNVQLVIPRVDLIWWGSFLISLLVGTLIGSNITPQQTSPTQLLTWAYFCLIFLSITMGLSHRSHQEIERILERIGVYGIIFHTSLLVYSYLVSSSVLGIDLWYGGIRFAGGGDNPHYLALVILTCLFIVLRKFLRERKVLVKVGHALLIIAAAWVGWATASTTLITSAIATAVFLAIVYFFRASRPGILWIIIGSLFVIGLAQYRALIDLVNDIIASDENGEGRLTLWGSYFTTFEPAYILGLGPGTHARGGEIEYHNLYIEVIAMSGVIGIALFLWFLLYSLRQALKVDILLAGPLLALIIYGVGGFSGRRLVFWVIFAVILVLSRSTRGSIPTKHGSKSKSPET